MRELLSASLPHGSWDEVLEHVADKVIQQKTKNKAEPKESKNLTTAKRKTIFRRDQCCQHVDPITKKKCGSKWSLQIDHIHPQWADGSNEINKLQLLCAQHNRQRYREQAGFH